MAPFRVGIKVSVTDGVPPAVNSAGVRRMIRATTEMLGSSAVTGTEQSLGARTSPGCCNSGPVRWPDSAFGQPESRPVRTCIIPIGGREPHSHRVEGVAELATSRARSANSL